MGDVAVGIPTGGAEGFPYELRNSAESAQQGAHACIRQFGCYPSSTRAATCSISSLLPQPHAIRAVLRRRFRSVRNRRLMVDTNYSPRLALGFDRSRFCGVGCRANNTTPANSISPASHNNAVCSGLPTIGAMPSGTKARRHTSSHGSRRYHAAGAGGTLFAVTSAAVATLEPDVVPIEVPIGVPIVVADDASVVEDGGEA